MKATELQIGDWVIFHDLGYASDGTTWEENRVCQIDSIDEDVRVKWYDESGCKEDWPHVSTVLLSPIPLTPEILEKNGFRKMKWESNSYVNSESEAAYICFSIGDYTNLWGGGDQDYVWVTVKYVHQLQQALRFCRIDKEIEL